MISIHVNKKVNFVFRFFRSQPKTVSSDESGDSKMEVSHVGSSGELQKWILLDPLKKSNYFERYVFPHVLGNLQKKLNFAGYITFYILSCMKFTGTDICTTCKHCASLASLMTLKICTKLG